jgi:Na+-transporting NADH:ubiquinone oxidoreductase subunit A
MTKVIKIKKGLSIHLKGKAEKKIEQAPPSATYALKPGDFQSLTPKLSVKEGFEVKAGTPLFFDKYRQEIKFTSTISGTVKVIHRGERRKILEVVIEPSHKRQYETFLKDDPKNLDKEKIREQLLNSGLWPAILQRPYGIIADPGDTPDNIFISCFNTVPLSPDIEFMLQNEESHFQTGIDALQKLTKGKIHLGLSKEQAEHSFFTRIEGAEKNYFTGPHPAGNVGIQIHQISPINKGDLIWTIKPHHVATIGKLFQTGQYQPEVIIALAGSEVKEPKYFKLLAGAQVTPLIDKNLHEDNVRIISGDVLTGKKIYADGYLGYYDNLISIIPEGNEPELFGWAMPGFKKFSMSKTFFTWLRPDKEYDIDTNMHGGERPFVVTGEMERVLPMDILPMQLLKAIIVNDIDLMEQLGIYEVVEEDFALCEFVSTSKIEAQQLIRQGLETIRKEFM